MDELRSKLVQETARIDWKTLAPFFARGQLLWVGPDLNLVEAAAAVAEDSSDQVSAWMSDQRLVPVSDEQAASWNDAQVQLWAVVVRPYVLVQDEASRTQQLADGD